MEPVFLSDILPSECIAHIVKGSKAQRIRIYAHVTVPTNNAWSYRRDMLRMALRLLKSRSLGRRYI
jgi:hypothetical protein